MKFMKFASAFFILVFLSACNSATTAPTLTLSPTLLPTVTIIPETPTAIATSTPAGGVENGGNYPEGVKISYTSPSSEVRVGTSDFQMTASTSVDTSGADYGVHQVDIEKETLSKLTLRALHNIFSPTEDDTDATLATFEKTLADIQTGKRPCTDLMKNVSVYTTGVTGPQQLDLVPACGGSAVPDGASVIKNIDFVYGAFFTWDANGNFINDPAKPWFNVVTPAGDGGGLIFDPQSGKLLFFVGMRFNVNPGGMSKQIPDETETALKWLTYNSQGEKWFVKSTNTEAKRSSSWASQMTVK